MKFKIAMLLMLLMSGLALANVYSGNDSDAMTIGYLFKCCVFLLFVTPFGWGAMFIVGYLIVSMSAKGVKKVATTDYSPVKTEDKEILVKQGLREAYIDAKRL